MINVDHVLITVLIPLISGFNNDCSVLFVNMGPEDLFMFGQGSVLIEWELVGPVEFTECRLETRVENGNDIIGEYTDCTFNNIVDQHPTCITHDDIVYRKISLPIIRSLCLATHVQYKQKLFAYSKCYIVIKENVM